MYNHYAAALRINVTEAGEIDELAKSSDPYCFLVISRECTLEYYIYINAVCNGKSQQVCSIVSQCDNVRSCMCVRVRAYVNALYFLL